jgi:hypothetical protein
MPPQPGWYDDPDDSNAQRYWDGQHWTPLRERKPISRPTPQRAGRGPIVIAAVIAAFCVGGVLAYKYVFSSSDEDQIRAIVKAATADQNNADGPGMLTLICTKDRGSNPATSEMLRNANNEQGALATSVTDVRITGDRATARVNIKMSKFPNDETPETWSFVKENGSWKWCGHRHGQ